MKKDKCFYCERKFNIANYGTNKPCAQTVDHIIPLSKNGSNKQPNLIDSCTECNHLKASLTLDEFISIVQNLIDTGKSYKTIPDTRLYTIIANSQKLKEYVEKNGNILYREAKSQEDNQKFEEALNKLMPLLPVKQNIRIKGAKQKDQLGFYDNPVTLKKRATEYELFLMQQTPEQFRLAKKFGWEFAKMITQPECNFHYEDQN